MLLRSILVVGTLVSLIACGEAAFTGKSGKKSGPKGETPATLTPGTDSPKSDAPDGAPGDNIENGDNSTPNTPVTNVPSTENPDTQTKEGDASICITQSGLKITCPSTPSTNPSQN